MNERYFKLARNLSMKSDHQAHQIGAVIVKKNRIISVGFNKKKTHPKSSHTYKYTHAEFDAILSIPLNELKNAEIYTFREIKNGTPAMSRPCESCQGMLKSVGIRKIHYSINNGYKSELL